MLRLFSSKGSSLTLLGIMMFFWSIFDGAMAYIAPLAVTQHDFSKTEMGLIIGSSSVVGAIFDLVSFKILPSTHFRRVFMIMFALCAMYPIVLYGASAIPLFLVAMAIWGVYYDLKNFGNLDFVGRYTKKEEHAKSFGYVQIFQSLGYLIAPIIVGMIIAEGLDWKAFLFAGAMLFISSIFFFELHIKKLSEPSQDNFDEKHHLRRKQFSEMKLWLSLDRAMFPVLMLTLMIFVVDALFWTIGPLFAESFPGNKELTGVYPHFKDFKEMWKVIEKKKNKYGKEMLDFSLLVFVNHAKGEEWINQFKSRFQTQQPFKCIWTLHLLYINNGQEVKKVVAQKFSSDQQFVRIVVDLDDTEVHKLQKFPNYVEKKEQDGNIYLYPKKEFGEMIKRKVKKF
jgi:hypothetical protein